MAYNKISATNKGFSEFFRQQTDFKSRIESAAINWINQQSNELSHSKKGMLQIRTLDTSGKSIEIRKGQRNVAYLAGWSEHLLDDGTAYPLLNVTIHGFSVGTITWNSKDLTRDLFDKWKLSQVSSNITPIDTASRHFNRATALIYSKYLANKLLNAVFNVEPKKGDELFHVRYSEEREALTIPVLRINGGGYELASLQWIYENPEIQQRYFKSESNKQFMAGTKVKGSLLPIFFAFEGKLSHFKLPENKSSPIYLAEGYATALACHLATKKVAICCFSCDNIEAIVLLLKGMEYSSIIIAADNDLHLKEKWLAELANLGITPESEKAKEVKASDSESKIRKLHVAYNVAYCVPTINTKFLQINCRKIDFADVYQHLSPPVCKEQLENLIKPAIHVVIKQPEKVVREMPLPPTSTLLSVFIQDILKTLYVQQVEVAACAALTVLSAMMQRHVTTPIRNDVCSLYLFLAGLPGSGKDGAASSVAMIDEIIHRKHSDSAIAKMGLYEQDEAKKENTKRSLNFITPASPQGVNKELSDKERPLKHQILAHLSECEAYFSDSKLTGMITFFKNAFTGKALGKKVHSDKEKNVESIDRATITLLGDTTINAIIDGLSGGNLDSNGWLSRLLCFILPSKKPIINRNCEPTLTNAYVIEELRSILDMMEYANKDNTFYSAIWDSKEVEKDYFVYDDLCRDKAHQHHESEIFLHEMYVRRAQIALRIATLVAAFGEQVETPNGNQRRINGLNCHPFRITREILKYAIDLVDWSFDFFVDKKKSGEIGAGDIERQNAICKILQEYIEPYNKDAITIKYKSRGVFHHLIGQDIIPLSYLSLKTMQLMPFKRFQGGANKALSLSIEHLLKIGVLSEVNQATLDDLKSAGYSGRSTVYQIHKENIINTA